MRFSVALSLAILCSMSGLLTAQETPIISEFMAANTSNARRVHLFIRPHRGHINLF